MTGRNIDCRFQESVHILIALLLEFQKGFLRTQVTHARIDQSMIWAGEEQRTNRLVPKIARSFKPVQFNEPTGQKYMPHIGLGEFEPQHRSNINQIDLHTEQAFKKDALKLMCLL